MSTQPFSVSQVRFVLFALLLGTILPGHAKAQLVVDCTGVTPGTYPSISAALNDATTGSAIFVAAGPCNEDVQIWGRAELFVGAWWGQRVNLNGSLQISHSTGLYFYGLNITSTTGNGINIANAQAIAFDSCTSNDNVGAGMGIFGGSEVIVMSPASFDNNATAGIQMSHNSNLQMVSWSGQPIDISNNRGPGLYADPGNFSTFGNTYINNNSQAPGSQSGFGVDLRSGSKAEFGGLSGPNVITGNQGGVSVWQGSVVSFWSVGPQLLIQNNGPFGVSAGLNSHVTIGGNADVSGHLGPGLDVFGNSQGTLLGSNNVHNNGVAGDPRSAAIRVDGNSEVLLRGGSVAQNTGPAILALVNSSVDLSGVSFSSNTGGVVVCDSSAYMVSDLTSGTATAPGVACRTPHALGNRTFAALHPAAPDFTAAKMMQAKYKALATKH